MSQQVRVSFFPLFTLSDLALSRPGPSTGRGGFLGGPAAGGQTEQPDDQEDDEAAPVEDRGRGEVPGGVGAHWRENYQEK